MQTLADIYLDSAAFILENRLVIRVYQTTQRHLIPQHTPTLCIHGLPLLPVLPIQTHTQMQAPTCACAQASIRETIYRGCMPACAHIVNLHVRTSANIDTHARTHNDAPRFRSLYAMGRGPKKECEACCAHATSRIWTCAPFNK
jgi:hypothetical protein